MYYIITDRSFLNLKRVRMQNSNIGNFSVLWQPTEIYVAICLISLAATTWSIITSIFLLSTTSSNITLTFCFKPMEIILILIYQAMV